MLERTDAITNEDLERITFVLAYPNICYNARCKEHKNCLYSNVRRRISTGWQPYTK